jgi:hypothetical protein
VSVLTTFCRLLLAALQNAENHISRGDNALSELVEFNAVNSHHCVETIATHMEDLLARMHPVPRYREFEDTKICTEMPSSYFSKESNNTRAVDNLKGNSFISTNTLKLVATAVSSATLEVDAATEEVRSTDAAAWPFHLVTGYARGISVLFEAALALQTDKTVTNGMLFVLKSFLWRLWCQAISITRWYALDFKSTQNYAPAENALSNLSGYEGIDWKCLRGY